MSKKNKIKRLEREVAKLEFDNKRLNLENISLKKDRYNQHLTNKVTIQELESLRLDHEPSFHKDQAI